MARKLLLTNLVRAVVLVVRLANVALEAGLDLSAYTDTITNFASRNLVTNPDCLANDLMSDADG